MDDIIHPYQQQRIITMKLHTVQKINDITGFIGDFLMSGGLIIPWLVLSAYLLNNIDTVIPQCKFCPTKFTNHTLIATSKKQNATGVFPS